MSTDEGSNDVTGALIRKKDKKTSPLSTSDTEDDKGNIPITGAPTKEESVNGDDSDDMEESSEVERAAQLRYWINPLHRNMEKTKTPLRRFAQCVASLCGIKVEDVIDEVTPDEFEKEHIKQHKQLADVMKDLLKDITLAKTTEEAVIKQAVMRGLLRAVNSHIRLNMESFGGVPSSGEDSLFISARNELRGFLPVGGKTKYNKRRQSNLPPFKIQPSQRFPAVPRSGNVTKPANLKKQRDAAATGPINDRGQPSFGNFKPFVAAYADYGSSKFMDKLADDVSQVIHWLNSIEDYYPVHSGERGNVSMDSEEFVRSIITLNETFTGFADIAVSDINTKYNTQFTVESLYSSNDVYVGFAKLVHVYYQRSMTNRGYISISKSGPGYSFQKDSTFANGKTKFQIMKDDQDMERAISFFADVKEIIRVMYDSKKTMKLDDIDSGEIKQRILVKTRQQ
jgi:hypothetical protein